MKFSEHLTAHITPEWHKQYVSYEAMKAMLYDAIEQAPCPDTSNIEVTNAFFARFDESFFQYCEKELRKINTFFSEKLAEATRKFSGLQSDLSVTQNAQQSESTGLRHRIPSLLQKNKNKTSEEHVVRKSMHDIKLAFSEFYLSLVLLQNYQSLNFTGFRKILKKHDKLLKSDRGSHWRQENVETAPFYASKEVDHLIKEIETTFTHKLESGNRQKAMKRLRVPPLGGTQNPWATFRFGLCVGIIIVLACISVIAVIYTGNDHLNDWQPVLRMYRGSFLVILFIFLLGINTYGWRTSGVNHVLIFELDPRHHLTHLELLEVCTNDIVAGFFGVIWLLSLLFYLFSIRLEVSPFISPLVLTVFCLLYLCNPFRILHYRARRWLLRVLFRIVTAPFHFVGFSDFWLADQLNSLSTVLLDFEYLICYYAVDVSWTESASDTGVCGKVSYGVRPLVACLPAWFRFAQCLRRYRDTRLAFPHVVNAGKYSTSFFVILFSTLHGVYKTQTDGDSEVIQRTVFFYLWIISAMISTCYTLIWDIKMDWGLIDKNTGENRFLREELVYSYKALYYLAILEDAVLRLTWTITASIDQQNYLHDEILKTILASLEVFRRFVWNFYRLENEHLNNCGQFRAVRDISIAPINANDQALLEQMMDDTEGVTNRLKTRSWRITVPRSPRSETRELISSNGEAEDDNDAYSYSKYSKADTDESDMK